MWRKGRSIGFPWRSCFWSFELLYADSFTRQLSGEYITGICGNQHNHGEVWMWTADTRKLCGGIAGLYIAGFLMGGMLEVLKRFLGFAGTKDVLLAGTVCYLVYAAVLPRYREWRKKSRIAAG